MRIRAKSIPYGLVSKDLVYCILVEVVQGWDGGILHGEAFNLSGFCLVSLHLERDW